ncbi:MAG TPA: alpha/beta fold hydrolase [Stellaceae bacterium]|nr:alpha/beta fold hydrolase [Stellaceae bacterium]
MQRWAAIGVFAAGILASGPTMAAEARIKVGSLTLAPCEAAGTYCGHMARPLDPTGGLKDTIDIFFEYFPARDRSQEKLGTLVAAEGGPGFPTTGSAETYLKLYAPLRDRRDVVMMDYRGTGHSGAIDCHPLQTAPKFTVENVARCGAQLGPRAPLYSAAYDADDLAAILDALGAGKVDLYGDSYGTWFAQAFAIRHGDRLRSIILDGAYPVAQVGGESPWWPFYAPAMRRKFDLVCARDSACAAAPGSSIDHIKPALELLRAHPFDAVAKDADGTERRFRADAGALALLMFGQSPAAAAARETDPAARALVAGDAKPLLRLIAESLATTDSRDPTANPALYSAGMFMAVTCRDAFQIFDMSLPLDRREKQRDKVMAETAADKPDLYGPFTLAEYRMLPLDYEYLDECVHWPVPPERFRPHDLFPAGAAYPDIPALIISGELDDITTSDEGRAAASLFRQGRHVIVANSFHVNALSPERDLCVADIARRFIATLEVSDTSCAAAIPPLTMVPGFPLRAADTPPATAAAGNQADLAIAAAVVWTAADTVARLESRQKDTPGPGLRGGSFTTASSDAGTKITLDGLRWTEDLAVSGTVEVSAGTGTVTATLDLAGPDNATGHVAASWPVSAAAARATLGGTIGGKALAATMPAP